MPVACRKAIFWGKRACRHEVAGSPEVTKSSLAHQNSFTDKKTTGLLASFCFVSVIWFKSSLVLIHWLHACIT